MMKDFSKKWISSKKPNKQRKYRYNVPLHMRGNLLNVHLSKELRQKYNLRALRVRVGDRVRIMRGQFKKQEGKVEEVNMKKLKIYISKIEHIKRDGTKARYPIEPSNLMLVELNTEDKKRFNAYKKNTQKDTSKDNVKDVAKDTKTDKQKTVKKPKATGKPDVREKKNTSKVTE
ncbi:MAG: 50S ribosomal protein L24 [Candidatus Woesearchaeota archaeon]